MRSGICNFSLVIGIYLVTFKKDMAMPTWAKVGIGWVIAAGTGIYGFILSKNDINKKRYEIMKARQRIKESNFVE